MPSHTPQERRKRSLEAGGQQGRQQPRQAAAPEGLLQAARKIKQISRSPLSEEEIVNIIRESAGGAMRGGALGRVLRKR